MFTHDNIANVVKISFVEKNEEKIWSKNIWKIQFWWINFEKLNRTNEPFDDFSHEKVIGLSVKFDGQLQLKPPSTFLHWNEQYCLNGSLHSLKSESNMVEKIGLVQNNKQTLTKWFFIRCFFHLDFIVRILTTTQGPEKWMSQTFNIIIIGTFIVGNTFNITISFIIAHFTIFPEEKSKIDWTFFCSFDNIERKPTISTIETSWQYSLAEIRSQRMWTARWQPKYLFSWYAISHWLYQQRIAEN